MQKSNGEVKDVLYVVLEYAEGGDLFDYVFTIQKKFTEDVARYYFNKLVSAIQYLHENEVIHRDLKLENILLDHDFNLKVADFGLSVRTNGDKKMSA
jgi:serine/threonine protein kinase